MRATIWGCRGSVATPGPGTLRYGGNTSCVELRTRDRTLIVLDAGTGVRLLGAALAAEPPATVHLLLTHLHLDHLEGLPFFAPLWNAGTELHVWGPPSPLRSLEDRIARYVSPPLFPRRLTDVPARLSFHDVPAEEWTIGGVRILAHPVTHPGPTVGYRLSEDSRSLAYIPDHEPALGLDDLAAMPPEWVSGHAVAAGADVLLHDAQYSADEYRTRVGWGHSKVDDAVTFAASAGARRLVLFHHDPVHGDSELETLLDSATRLWGDAGTPPALAREGLTLELA
jgi:phosphoribosyl 1,2-cyclic phosphodiesterase